MQQTTEETKTIEDQLLRLKSAAIEATAKADVEFYEGYLAEDAQGVTPLGILSKNQIIEAIAKGGTFKSSKIEDTRVKVIGQNAGLVTYKATFEKPDGSSLTLFISTLYEKREGAWKGVFYQQSPLPRGT